VVVCEPGAAVTADELIAFCGQHLAGYKKPKAVDFVDSLPVSGYGKILRREVREHYWKDQDVRIGGGAPASGEAA
jgi:acyl-CoA synthetase (AMP-forming)/AMP-acid ligase II